MMKRIHSLAASVALVLSLSSAPAHAAGSQAFFQGYWRCQNKVFFNITPAFGPWLSYKVTSGSFTSQAYVYHDNVGGGWVNSGVDSDGGYWAMTSTGWQGAQLTFTGTYTNKGRPQSQRQVMTRNSSNALTVQTWRGGTMVGNSGCNK